MTTTTPPASPTPSTDRSGFGDNSTPAAASPPPDHTSVDCVSPASQNDSDSADAPRGQTPGSQPLLADAKRYRKRAQAAEQQLATLRAQVAQQTDALEQHEHTIAALERRTAIDEQLIADGVVDLDVARLLVKSMIQEADDTALDVVEAAAELRRSKPYLFQPPTVVGTGRGAMSPRVSPDATNQADAALAQAQETGHGADLLRYLRARRRP